MPHVGAGASAPHIVPDEEPPPRPTANAEKSFRTPAEAHFGQVTLASWAMISSNRAPQSSHVNSNSGICGNPFYNFTQV